MVLRYSRDITGRTTDASVVQHAEVKIGSFRCGKLKISRLSRVHCKLVRRYLISLSGD